MTLYTVKMQMTPGDDSIYTTGLTPGGDSWTYETYAEAEAKMLELKATDTTDRVYDIHTYEQSV
jgi:hypothetical protein